MNLKIKAEFNQYKKLVLGEGYLDLDRVIDNILEEKKHKPKNVTPAVQPKDSELNKSHDHTNHQHGGEQGGGNHKVTSPYGMRFHPVDKTNKFHYGIDLRGAEGSPIYAGMSGVVSAVGHNTDSGYYIEINHGEGLVSSYSHLSAQNVKKGQSVNQGDVIGAVGKTGKATGPHLHFAIKINGNFVDPTEYVNKWRIL